jgi:2,3-bisphosphoglycerate-independent phosphoglycerate mutase
MRRLAAVGLTVLALATAVVLGNRARLWNEELALPSPPLAHVAPRLDDPRTPRLSRRVVLIVIDGLGADEAHLPYLDELRARGVAATARVPYPTISRPNYVTILTGVPPRDSGVRANRVDTPVAVDTIMDRVQAAGLRVATASDFGNLMSLFARHSDTLDVRWIEHGTHLSPPPPVTWPADEVVRVPTLAALGPAIAELAAGDAAFVPVLVLDVDRAGHASGIGPEYRAAAQGVDAMLRVAFAGLDLARDTVIITADHGHVAPGGHGGDEREVSNVPLVLAGAGIVPGSVARDARLIDVAPTVAALLGLPAPGHAEGRALVEVLALEPAAAAHRAAADNTRASAIEVVTDVHADAPSIVWLAAVLAGLATIVVLGRRHLHVSSLAGAIGFAVMLVAIVLITRGRLSPSYIPSLARTEQLGAIGIAAALVLQVATSWFVVGRARDRLACGNALAVVSLAIGLGSVGLVHAWFAPPFLDVPPPLWMVAIPTLDLAAATCAAGAILTLAFAAIRSR